MAVCKILTSEEDIAALATQWEALQQDVGAAPFTGYSWAMAWWRFIGKPSGAKLMIVAAYEKETLVGLLPFSIRKKHGVRILRLLGHEVYYYRNFLVKESTLLPFIWETALAQPCYDFANIKNIHQGSEEDHFFSGRAHKINEGQVFHCADLGQQRDEFMKRYSRSFRRKIRRTQKLLDTMPELELDYCRGEPVPDDVVEFLVRRKKEWTIERGKRGIFDEEDPLSFYRELINISAKEGRILLNWMRLDGEVVAATFSVIEKKVLYGHTLAFAKKAGRFAPGIFLFMEALLWASENGMSENNFMEGEEEYKTRFSKDHRVIHEYAYARTFIGRLYHALYACLRCVRRLKTHCKA